MRLHKVGGIYAFFHENSHTCNLLGFLIWWLPGTKKGEVFSEVIIIVWLKFAVFLGRRNCVASCLAEVITPASFPTAKLIYYKKFLCQNCGLISHFSKPLLTHKKSNTSLLLVAKSENL